jgi:formylglycine-generating enzyme required for sulfatase activity
VLAPATSAGVFNMPAGQTSLLTVPVGNSGNAADTADGDGFTGGVQRYGQVNYAYNIGKYEVTAGQYTVFLNAVAAADPYRLYNDGFGNMGMADTSVGSGITRSGSSGNFSYSVDAAFVNRPVNFVSWGDAARFANWLANGQPTGAEGPGTTETGSYTLNGAISDASLLPITRNANASWVIPSEDEWYKAAYYNPVTQSYYLYPTSSDTAPGHDTADPSGNNANSYQSGYPYPIQAPYYTTVVGEFQNSASPYGTFDQAGNVEEWNEGIKDFWRGFRGGDFTNGQLCMLPEVRGMGYPTYEHAGVGFRVALIPEPASLAFLGFGVAALLTRRHARKR